MESLLSSFGLDGKILLWQMVNFGILFLILSRFLFRPVKKLMKEREERVRESLTQAEKLEKKSKELEEKLKKDMASQRKELEEMHAKSLALQEKIRKEMKIKAEEEVKKMMEDARALAEEEKRSLVESLEGEIKTIAVALASKVLEKEIDEKKQKELLEEAVKTLKKQK